jgi:hypothetical protein
MEWIELKADELEYSETKKEEESKSNTCMAHVQDCGTIRKKEKCQCGNHKDSHHSFCTSCHSILPEDLGKDVDWCPEVYAAAIEYLTE